MLAPSSVPPAPATPAPAPHSAPARAFHPGSDRTPEPAGAPLGLDSPGARPRFGTLDQAGCEALLARHTVGRLAYLFRGQVHLVPIHYALRDGWLYGRTGPGSKLTALRHHPWIAFEVDEVDDTYDWRSVVVRGALYLIERDGAHAERARWQRALQALRRVTPDALTPDDPTPERGTLFRVHLGEVTGRWASTSAAAP